MYYHNGNYDTYPYTNRINIKKTKLDHLLDRNSKLMSSRKHKCSL